MKKLILMIIMTVMCLSLIGVSAETATAQDRTVMNDVQKTAQSRMERKVRSEILSLPYYDVFDAIGFQINGNTVILNGYVVRPLTKEDAEESVRDVEGVTRVVNNIEVLPLSPSDDRIRMRIYREMIETPGLYKYLLGTNPPVRIIVKNGRVMLEGFVDSEADKNLAGIRAKEIFGVFGVENNLRVLRREV